MNANTERQISAMATFAQNVEVKTFGVQKDPKMSVNVEKSHEWSADTDAEFPEDEDAVKKQRREENRLAQYRAALLKKSRQEYMGPDEFAAWSTRNASANKKKKDKKINRGEPSDPKAGYPPLVAGPHNQRNRLMRENRKRKLHDVMVSAEVAQ